MVSKSHYLGKASVLTIQFTTKLREFLLLSVSKATSQVFILVSGSLKKLLKIKLSPNAMPTHLADGEKNTESVCFYISTISIVSLLHFLASQLRDNIIKSLTYNSHHMFYLIERWDSSNSIVFPSCHVLKMYFHGIYKVNVLFQPIIFTIEKGQL